MQIEHTTFSRHRKGARLSLCAELSDLGVRAGEPAPLQLFVVGRCETVCFEAPRGPGR